jgi:protein SCO1/2
MGVDTKQGDKIDLNLLFTTSEGKKVRLSDLLIPNRPFIITPVYYDCPHLCGFFLNGALEAFNNLGLKIGDDFSVITVSFDTSETPIDATKKGTPFRERYHDTSLGRKGWHFLVGDPSNVDPLMKSIGFNYLPDQGEFAHSAVMVILSPEGVISQYFTGVTFNVSDVKLAVVDASKGRIGSLLDHAMLFCFRFDPYKGKYTLAASLFLRLGVILTVILISIGMAFIIKSRKINA